MGAKKPKWQKTSVAKRTASASPFRILIEAASALVRNIDTVLIVLGVFHLIFMLVILASIGQINEKLAQPEKFGEQREGVAPPPVVSLTREQKKVQSIMHTTLYGLYTALMWAGLLWKKKKLDRQFRFMVIMVAPGTLLTIFLIYRMITLL